MGDKATLVFFRGSNILGGAIRGSVDLDGEALVTLSMHSAARVDVAPGKHKLNAHQLTFSLGKSRLTLMPRRGRRIIFR